MLSKDFNREGIISRLIRFVFNWDADTQCEFAWKGAWVSLCASHLFVGSFLAIFVWLASFEHSYDLLNGWNSKMVLDTIGAAGWVSAPLILATLFMAVVMAFCVVVMGAGLVFFVILWTMYFCISGEWTVDKQSLAIFHNRFLPWYDKVFFKPYCYLADKVALFKDKYCKPINYK